MKELFLSMLLNCPGLNAHIVINEYDGPVVLDLCVSDFVYNADTVSMVLYDNESDGIFRNDFENRE